MNSQRCLSCTAEVVFVPSAKSGRLMILDAQPRKDVVLVVESLEDYGWDFAAYPIDEDTRALVVDVYTDHHATCPEAASWKGRRR